MIAKVVIILFIVLESLNILTLYFKPQATAGNGIGVFKAFSDSRMDPATKALVDYLINWVAGAKLIFVALLVVIVFTGNSLTQQLALFAMMLSIGSYFWRLHPMMAAMDKADWLVIKGYSKTLSTMIAGIIGIMFIGLCLSFFIS